MYQNPKLEKPRKALGQVPDSELSELLPLEGQLVLGVFPEVAQSDGLLNSLRKKNVQLVNELLDLLPDLIPNPVLEDRGRPPATGSLRP